MKKLVSLGITLLLLLISLWGLSSWYFGSRTENAFKAAIQNITEISGEKLLRAKLLSYRKTLIGADASLRFSSDNPFLSERLGEFDIHVKLFNGPVFMTKSGISLGISRWIMRIDETALTEEQSASLKSYFPKFLPTVNIRLDFAQKAHYFTKARSVFADSLISGIYDLEKENNRGAIRLSNFICEVALNQVSAEHIQISYQHPKADTVAYQPGSFSIHIPKLKINSNKLYEPIVLSVKVNSDISINNKYLNGFIKVNTVSSKQYRIPISNAELTLQFKGISSSGLVRLSEATAELDNLQQQTQWVLEEQGELPAGQDQIWQLQNSLDKATKDFPKTIKEHLFDPDDSEFHVLASTSNASGKSTLSGEIKVAEIFTSSSHLISLFESQAKVKLDDDLYQYLSSVSAINKKRFRLGFKQNKLFMQ